MRKLWLPALIALAITAYFLFGLDRMLTFETLQREREGLAARVAAQPLAAAAVYFVAYVIMAAFSFPGALILTLAGGALFGLAGGTLLVSFASSLGALFAFLSARYLFREAIARRFGARLASIDAGIERDGPFHLLTLRLLPILPFFAVNLLMGLTRMRAVTYYLVSQIGMLPATLLYVNAGTQLADVDRPADLLSLPVLGALAALAALPWLARFAVEALRRRRIYARFRRPKRFDRNLIVIGGGAAGLVTAYVAAAVRAKVTLVEGHRMGGDCLNTGCVPSKALIHIARRAQDIREAGRLGLVASPPEIDFPAVMREVRRAIDGIAPHDSVARYEGLGVEVRTGHARLVDPWTVAITDAGGGETRLTARAIVLATGAAPFVPPIPGLQEIGYLTSDTLWDDLASRPNLPRRIVVLGGGPIGCELAQALARLGGEVTLVESAVRLLLREDDAVSEAASTALTASGVFVRTGHRAVRAAREGDTRVLHAEGPDGPIALPFDALIVATGRAARLRGFGLEELGIPAGRVIETNAWLETLYPNIYAAGDAAGPYQFTHAAGHQGWHAAVNALFGTFKRFAVDYSVLPAVTFLDPEIARVGLNERDAKEQGIAYEATRFELHELDRAIADGATEGFVLVLTPPGKDRILGATIVGARAGDLLAEFTLAMKAGIGLNRLLGTIHPYPTYSEAAKYTAGLWKKAHAPERVLGWLARYHAWRRGA